MSKQKGDNMKAVFEELNGDTAVFVVDDRKEPYYLDVSELPKNISTGDVFEVDLKTDGTLKLGDKLTDERKRREEASRAKREELLKRNNED